MSHKASAYEQVRDLCNTLSNAGNVTDRRKASEQLRNLLGDVRFQTKLGRETGHDPLKIASVWRLAITNSLLAAQRLTEGRGKRTKIQTADMRLPGAILMLVDKDSGQYLPSIFGGEDVMSMHMGIYGGGGGGSGSSGGAGMSGAASSSSSSSNQPTSLADPRCCTRLSSKEIQKLLEFCVNALADEECREVAEPDLMNTLSTLCSRADYVAHFHAEKDVEFILSEIEERLLPTKGRVLGGVDASAATRMAIVENAAKTLAHLIYHLAVSLGYGMHKQLASCFDLIVKWCKLSSSQPRQTANQCLHYVMSAATSLLLTHPEQCVPIMRENGRYLLALVKKSFTLTSGQTRDALIDYYSAHLYVCEIAGKMQGLLPGDLGNIGRASLNPSQVDSILAMLISDKQMAETFPAVTTDAAKSRKRKRQSSSGGQKIKRQGAEWSSLTRRQRRHLELSARLLYCSQRYWAAKHAVVSSNDPTDMVLFGEERSEQDATSSGASDSPFLLQVASKLCAKRFLPKIEDAAPALTAPTATMTMTQTVARVRSLRGDTHDSADSPGSFLCDPSSLPMMKALATMVEAGGSKFASTPSALLACLRLLCACADAFPSGSCWSLDNSSWNEYQGTNVVLPHIVRQKVASSIDTASIVYIALTILISSGGASGDANVQMWALTCLLKLTGPSLFACRGAKTDREREATIALANVWADVYKTLLRSDLKYASYTASAYEGSLGELVIMLLTEINSLLLTDPKLSAVLAGSSAASNSTLSSTDTKIWSLPVFRDATQVQTRAPFELITQTLRRSGLLEHGADAINRSALGTAEIVLELFGEEDGSDMQVSQLAQSRRYRLLVFCLRFIQEATTVRPSDTTLRRVVPLACECATILIGRNGTSFPTSFSFIGKSTFGVVDTARDYLNFQPRSLPLDDPLAALWKDHLIPPQITNFITDIDDSFCGMLWGQQLSLHHLASFRDTRDDDVKELEQLLSSSDANIVSPVQAKSLREWSISYMKQCLVQAAEAPSQAATDLESAAGGDSEGGAETGDDEAPAVDKDSIGPLVTKALISLALADDNLASCAKNLVPIEEEITTSVESSLERLSKLSRDEFDASLTDLLGVFRALLCLSSLGCQSIVSAYGANAKRFYNECHRALQFYAKRSDDGTAGQQQSPPVSGGRASQDARGASGRYGRASSSGRAGRRISIDSFGDSDESDDEDFGSNSGAPMGTGVSRMKPADESDDFDDSDEEHLMSATVNRGDKRRRGGPNGSSRIPIRAQRGSEAATQRRRVPEPPYPRGAWLCAAAMLVVDPSVDCVKSVTECLVWPDFLNEDDQNPVITTIDRTDALACLGLFLQSDVLLRERLTAADASESDREETDEETVVYTCADIIDTVRAADNSSSALHLTGFGTIATLVQFGETYDMPSGDTKFLIDVLNPEGNSKGDKSNNVAKRMRRSLRRRPRMKAHQLNAVIRAFLGGSDYFHSLFDGTYATSFVVPSICNIDSQVREIGTEAIAAALKKLPNQRPIVKSVIRVLAPLSLTGDEGRVKKHYDRWLKERMDITESENPVDYRAWQDARESMEYCSIKCRGIIAASTQDEDIARENILHLIRLSMERPALLMPCYRACEHAAVSRGYSNVEDLFTQEREWILQELIHLRVELTYFPLIVTSPPTVRSLLRLLPSQAVSGHQSSERQSETGANQEDAMETDEAASIDIDRLEGDAASQYVDAVASTLIPLIVLESPKLSEGDNDDDEEEIEQGWSKVAWKYMEDASTTIKGGKSDGDISTVVRKHIHDVYALLFPIFQCSEGAPGDSDDGDALDDEDDEDERQAMKKLIQKKATGAIGALKGVISEEIVAKQAARISHLVVREALRLKGRRIAFGKYVLPSSCFLSAVEYVSSGLASGTKVSSGKDRGLFERAGSSSTECLLDARRWMDQAATRTQEQRSWQVIESICDQTISELDETKNQMGFLVHTLLSVLLDARFEVLRPQVLSTLFDVMATMLRSEKGTIDWNDDQILLMMNEVLPSLVHLHETYQSSMIQTSLNAWRKERRESRRIKGLLPDQSDGNDDGGDVWGWDKGARADADAETDASLPNADEIASALAKSAVKTTAPNTYKTITKIYDLLELILLKSPKELDAAFSKIDPLPTSSLSNDQIAALTKENFKYSLTALLLRFKERKGGTDEADDDLSSCDIEHELEHFLSLFRRHQFGSDATESGALDVHLRSLVSGLARLEQVFALSSLKSSVASEITFGPLLYKTIQMLFKVCQANFPSTVRIASSRCIGELSSFDLTSFSNLTATHALDEVEEEKNEGGDHDGPLVTMEKDVFKLLAIYFKSHSSETAIAAKDTAKFLLRTREGARGWKKMDLDDEIRHLLSPLSAHGRKFNRSDLPELDKTYVERLYQKSGEAGGSDGIDDDSWCWSQHLWVCPESSGTSYAEWIRDLVCSVILCRYSRGGSGRKQSSSEAKTSSADGRGDYFHCLLPMCAREAEFAASVFPGLIFDLLSSDDGRDSARSKNDAIRSEIAVGASDSETNRTLTRCFSYLITPPSPIAAASQQGPSTTIETNTKALEIIVDTLDSLRRVVQYRWVSSTSHKRNTTKLPTQKKDSTSKKRAAAKRKRATDDSLDDSQYTADLPATPEWRGVPFGIVLHLSGLDVARACLRANRYASALFYSEMFADNRFGGSGGIFERLSKNDSSTSSSRDAAIDISGFGLHSESATDSIANTSSSVALELSDITKKCLAQFRETDCLEGIQTQDSAIRFYHDAGGTSMHQEGGLSEMPVTNDWDSLLALDMRQQLPRRSEYSSNALAITSHLKTVGLRHIMRRYMVGLEGIDEFSQDNEAKLKDQWFEESWRTLQWDDTLLSPAPDDSGSLTLTAGVHSGGPSEATMSHRGRFESEIGWNGGGLNRRGMNECINVAFNNALDEESGSHSKAVIQARQALLDELCSSVGNESLMAVLPDYSTKLMAFNELDKMKGGLFAGLHQPVSSTLKVLGYTDDDVDSSLMAATAPTSCIGFQPNVGFSSLDFLMSIREVTLRVSAQKRPEDAALLRSTLTSHLLGFSALARQCNRPEVAGTCLQRLRNVMEISEASAGDSISKLHSSLRLHLEDARLDSAKGNFGSAIRTCKLVLNKMSSTTLSGAGDGVKERHRTIMSDAGALCGDSMVEYKVESGKTILHDYLKPASSMALKVYEKNNSAANGQRASQSQFALAAFVASLYDNVVDKVKSQEWIRARVTADERRAELQICNKMLEKANKENADSKPKSGARSGTARTGAQSRTKQTLEEMTKKEHRELQMHVLTLKKELRIDEKETKAVERAVSEYLHLAIESFAKALSIYNPSTMSEDVSKHIFRMVSLWFANSTEFGVNELMRQYQDSVSTHHFVPLTYQIFARIDSAGQDDTSNFQGTLRDLVFKMCTDHPYHCLIQLITLANGSKVGASDAPGRTNAYLQYAGNSKVDASVSILESLKRLKGSSAYVASLVESYIALSSGYIDLAMFPTSKFHGDKKDKGKPPPKKIALSVAKSGGGRSTQKSLDQIIMSSGGKKNFKCAPCVLTKPPMLRPGRDYGHGNEDPIGSERIETFDPNFSITDTGIHRPKIVKCIGSKGGIFKQLVKGEDDIRQDAVMQQVFNTVNNLLRGGGPQKNAARSLNLVTYNIIPLSPVSGVLEWVDDTMPFGDFLNDKGTSKSDRIGAHSRYFPGEWSNRLCQVYFMDAPTHERRKALDEIFKRFSPAFRYFFVERFAHSLQAWHTARTTYTRSVAVNSIVGHVLGIGDRHCNNILVHQKTGEVVHIDFGIVFEQGKCLNTPETVPFRLTRDVVDGMGPSGTEGCFSLSAEATATVLRDNAETLLTILSAVVSDPLYKWSMSPLQARKVQRAGARSADDEDDEDAGEEDADGALADAIGKHTSSAADENNEQNENEAATRAIQKIHQKLQGYEEGNTGERQSVEGQVQLLINEARDPDNLCNLYHGWAPWN